MAQQRALPQSKETLLQSYNKRLKDDVKSVMDNFTEIIKTAKIEEETQVSRATQGEQDNYEMHVRAANIVRAGESLMRLVSDLKQFLILNDFPSVNEAIDQRNQQLRALQEECDRKLVALRDEVSIDLYELEEEYYSSSSSLGEANDLPLCEAYWRPDLDTDSADGLAAPPLASPEPGAGPLQAAATAHSHAGGPRPHGAHLTCQALVSPDLGNLDREPGGSGPSHCLPGRPGGKEAAGSWTVRLRPRMSAPRVPGAAEAVE